MEGSRPGLRKNFSCLYNGPKYGTIGKENIPHEATVAGKHKHQLWSFVSFVVLITEGN